MLNKKKKEKKKELSYRIHLKFNLSDTHISWKRYLIGSLTPKINIHLMAYVNCDGCLLAGDFR
jgi:hypothetical protein